MGLPLRAARIDISAIVRNLRIIEESVAPASVLVDVSSDAYGHGAAEVARAMQGAGVRCLVVATVAEAVALRRSGIDAPILAWLHPAAETFQAAADYRISVAVSSPEQLAAARAAGVSSVHLAVSIGGNTLGCPTALWGTLVDEATRLNGPDAPSRNGNHGVAAAAHAVIPQGLRGVRQDQREFLAVSQWPAKPDWIPGHSSGRQCVGDGGDRGSHRCRADRTCTIWCEPVRGRGGGRSRSERRP